MRKVSSAISAKLLKNSEDLLFEAVQRLAERYYPSEHVSRVQIEFDGGEVIRLPVPTPSELDGLDPWQELLD